MARAGINGKQKHPQKHNTQVKELAWSIGGTPKLKRPRCRVFVMKPILPDKGVIQMIATLKLLIFFSFVDQTLTTDFNHQDIPPVV